MPDKKLEDDNLSQMFGDIAGNYELLNQIISFGQIHRWRKEMVKSINFSRAGRALDICCGPGNLSRLIAKNMPEGEVVGVDFSREMIRQARQKTGEKSPDNLKFQVGDATELEFAANQFDYVTVAFGLRNIEELDKAVREMLRVLKPGGTAASLDLGKPKNRFFRKLYGFYFHRIMPSLAGLIMRNKKPYKHLSNSLKRFPDQKSLQNLFVRKGFKDVYYKEFINGIAVVHVGQKAGD